jgi:hypothetical protein
VASVVLLMGVVSLAGAALSIRRHREAAFARALVWDRSIALLEKIAGSDRKNIATLYDGMTFAVDGVDGTYAAGDAVQVNIDESNPKLIRAVLSASWTSCDQADLLDLEMEFFSRDGQCSGGG